MQAVEAEAVDQVYSDQGVAAAEVQAVANLVFQVLLALPILAEAAVEVVLLILAEHHLVVAVVPVLL
jgi:hypothetical protein